MNHRLLPLLLCCLNAVIGEIALAAASPLDFGNVTITLAGDSGALDALKASEQWTAACQNLGKSLVSGSGPWGFGLFGGFKCKKFGTKDKADAGWTLWATAAPNVLRFEMRHSDLDQPVAKTDIPVSGVSGDLLERMGKSKLATLIAADLLEKLPVWARINSPQIRDNGKKLELPIPSKLKNFPQAPKQLAIYTLTFEPQRHIWQAHVIAKADQTETRSKKKLTWVLDRPVSPGGSPVYAHDYRGRGANAEILGRLIEDAAKKPLDDDDFLGGNLAAAASRVLNEGFIGVRLGKSLSSGQLARKIKTASLLAELRGAPLDGLRLYHDVWPKISEEAAFGPTSFSGSRTVLGWALGMDLYDTKLSGLIDRIDFVPKIGVWSMKSQFKLAPTNDTVAAYDFNFASSLSTGVELGVEKQFASRALLRLWLGADFSSIAGSAATAAKINDVRAGSDLLVNVATLGPIHWSILGFGVYERIQLAKQYPDGTREAALKSISLSLAMVGGGLALAW
ncbi:MAG: hypothetical protein FJ146_19430 [Deltaproteobacteria bacterium]|nr:hypothetical protein [Deltaproteobacteria bacterium]